MVEKFHPAIKIIRETPKIGDAFSPLVYVPVNFVFDKVGKWLFPNSPQGNIDKDKLAEILAAAKKNSVSWPKSRNPVRHSPTERGWIPDNTNAFPEFGHVCFRDQSPS
jgi:hypothetical protein